MPDSPMETSIAASTNVPPLWLLPAELFDAIVEDLSWVETIQLWRSSPNVAHRLDPKLFGCSAALNRSMLYACTQGDVRLIRAAVAHGADVSLVNIHRSEFEQFPHPYKEVYRTSTLVFAAKKRHEEAFAALLDLGATIEASNQGQLRALVKAVGRAGCESMLRKIFDTVLGSRILDRAGLELNIVALIRKGAPVGLLEAILDHGADPNIIVRGKKSCLESPLSMAVEMGSQETFELLIRRGADIHGHVECRNVYHHNRKAFLYDRPNHIPIYAAVARMAKTGLCDMIDLCLHYGADINMKVPAFLTPHHRFLRYYPRYFAIRPFWAYLESIASRMIKNIFEVRDGIDYFAKRGGDFRLAEREISQWPWLPTAIGGQLDKHSEVELFLYSWEPRRLQGNRFFNVVDYLEELQSRADVEFSMDLDDSYEKKTQYQWWKFANLQIEESWKTCPDSLHWLSGIYRLPAYIWVMKDKSRGTQFWKDAILSSIVMYMSNYPHHFGTYDRLVLDRLQESGADINGFLAADHMSQICTQLLCNPLGNPFTEFAVEWPEEQRAHRPLHGVCRKFNSIYARTIGPDSQTQKWENKYMREMVKKFCLALVQRGANPDLLVDNWSAVDILTKDLAMAEEPTRQYITEMVQTMREGYKNYVENGSTPIRG